MTDAGTVVFWLEHPIKSWTTNDKEYRFPPVEQGPVGVAVTKRGDRSLEVRVAFEKSFVMFGGPMPTCPPRGLHVAVTWEKGTVKLYLNGSLVDTAAIPQGEPPPMN